MRIVARARKAGCKEGRGEESEDSDGGRESSDSKGSQLDSHLSAPSVSSLASFVFLSLSFPFSLLSDLLTTLLPSAMSERDTYGPLPSAVVKGLGDKIYDKRKNAALEVEKCVLLLCLHLLPLASCGHICASVSISAIRKSSCLGLSSGRRDVTWKRPEWPCSEKERVLPVGAHHHTLFLSPFLSLGFIYLQLQLSACFCAGLFLMRTGLCGRCSPTRTTERCVPLSAA